MKRWFSGILAGAMMVMMLTSCGGKETGESQSSSVYPPVSGTTTETGEPTAGASQPDVSNPASSQSSATAPAAPESSQSSEASRPSADTSSGTSGQPADKDLLIYPVPEGTPQATVCFYAKANGQNLGVYSDTNAWKNPVNFTYFHIKEGTKVQVEIEPTFDFKTYKILPDNLGVKSSREGRKISFEASKAGQSFTIVFDDNYKGAVIHVFVAAIDPNQPTKSTEDVIYFGPGYHDLYKTHNGQLTVGGTGRTVYIAPGAVVNGTVFFSRAENCAIQGGGVLMMSGVNPNQYNRIPLVFSESRNCTVGKVIVNSRAIPLDGMMRGSWSTHLYMCDDMTVDGYRVVSPTYASTDSLNISSSRNVTVKNCFLRACDDTISIKGLYDENNHSAWKPIQNIHISDTILWSDCNNAMVVGEESRAEYYKNISFKNIDVLFSYDDRDNHLNLDERAAMSIVCLDGTYFSDILFDNIRINNCQRLVCMTFKDDFWFGSLQGHQQYEGGISGVTFSNITSNSPNDSFISNEILLSGYTAGKNPTYPKKYIENITFSNFKINGVKLTASYNRLYKNDYVRNLIFK